MYSEAWPLSCGHRDPCHQYWSLAPGTFHLEVLIADPCLRGQKQVGGGKLVSGAGPRLSLLPFPSLGENVTSTMGLRGWSPGVGDGRAHLLPHGFSFYPAAIAHMTSMWRWGN